MTRQGTLAYYLAAWVIGCPVVALVFWLTESVEHGIGNLIGAARILLLRLDVRGD